MTAWGNIDKANNIMTMDVDNISWKDRVSRPDRIETTDGYDIHRIKNNKVLDEWYREDKDIYDENWIWQNTSWLVQDIPNISFLDIWDTLIESKKTTYNRRWAKLIIWMASKSVELLYMNKCQIRFEPWYASDIENRISVDALWPYVDSVLSSQEYAQIQQIYWPLAVYIKEDWVYKVTHKEEIVLQSTQDTVDCYVDVCRKDVNDTYQIYKKIAVSRWEWKWTLTWTTSWTEPSWSCSVSFKLWQLIQRMPVWWSINTELKAWDVLVLRCKDNTPDPTTWQPRWNDLTLVDYSNIFSVEYVDLPDPNI